MDSAEALDTVFVIPLGAPQSGRAPLTDRAILRSASIAAAGGVGTIMFTGEALRRRGIVALVEAIHELPAATGPMRVALSTDRIRLPALARALAGPSQDLWHTLMQRTAGDPVMAISLDRPIAHSNNVLVLA